MVVKTYLEILEYQYYFNILYQRNVLQLDLEQILNLKKLYVIVFLVLEKTVFIQMVNVYLMKNNNLKFVKTMVVKIIMMVV